jgi:hypothetical protein
MNKQKAAPNTLYDQMVLHVMRVPKLCMRATNLTLALGGS